MRKNIFIYGLSGSGKDTISDFLRDQFGYLKLRIAGTIKQYVFETYGFKTQEEFEEAKRNNPEVRKAHNIFGKQYDSKGLELSNKEATENRIDSLIQRTALEFEILNNMKEQPICIVDVRNKFEAEKFLNAGFVGIFLNRRNNEYADTNHKTEQNMFRNGELADILVHLKSNDTVCIVINDNNFDLNQANEMMHEVYGATPNNGNNTIVAFTRGNVEQLLVFVKLCIDTDFNSQEISKFYKTLNKK